MSRTSSVWIAIIVVLGIMLGIVGGGIMGGLVGMYVAQNSALQVPAVVPQEIRAVTSGQPPVVQNLTVNAETELTDTVSRVQPAVVTVVTDLSSGAFGRSGVAQASGSGVIISQDGHIVTNEHVIEGARDVAVIYNDGTRVDASVVGSDPLTDIAVLKVNGNVPGFAQFGDSSALKLGEWVIAIGSPLGNYRGSVTVGVVSGMNRTVVGSGQAGLIQTDAAINHGNSGGPLLNLAGQIVGINTLVVRDSPAGDQAEGLGFAVPSNIVRTVAEQLIAKGRIDYPFIGISYEEITPGIAAELNLKTRQGVIITDITPNSPAASAGLQPQDVLVAINNEQISETNPLRTILFKYHIGDQVTLTIERNGQNMQIKLTLGARSS